MNQNISNQNISIDDLIADATTGSLVLLFLGFTIILSIFLVSLVFFVKLWNMTNDISEIKELIKTNNSKGSAVNNSSIEHIKTDHDNA